MRGACSVMLCKNLPHTALLRCSASDGSFVYIATSSPGTCDNSQHNGCHAVLVKGCAVRMQTACQAYSNPMQARLHGASNMMQTYFRRARLIHLPELQPTHMCMSQVCSLCSQPAATAK
jgi:hypothetical protein